MLTKGRVHLPDPGACRAEYMCNQKQKPRFDSSRAPAEAAFSAFELVIVVSTLVLLAAVFLPALAHSSDQGTRTICMSNLRKLGMASCMYASDNRDYLAYPNWGTTTPWAGWAYGSTNAAIPDPGPGGAYATNRVAAYATGLWFPYVREPNAYLCPVDMQSPSYLGRPDGGVMTRLQRLSSYVMNGAVSGYDTQNRSARISDVWNPRSYLLFGPDENYKGIGVPGAFDFNDAANYPDRYECIENLHTINGGLILTVAGNIEFVSRATFISQSTSSTRNLVWWSPFNIIGH